MRGPGGQRGAIISRFKTQHIRVFFGPLGYTSLLLLLSTKTFFDACQLVRFHTFSSYFIWQIKLSAGPLKMGPFGGVLIGKGDESAVCGGNVWQQRRSFSCLLLVALLRQTLKSWLMQGDSEYQVVWQHHALATRQIAGLFSFFFFMMRHMWDS